jgi:hypothetical protein
VADHFDELADRAEALAGTPDCFAARQAPLGNSTLDAPVPPKRKPDASTRAMSPKEGTTSWTRTPSRGSGRRIRKTSRYGNKETSDNNGVVE